MIINCYTQPLQINYDPKDSSLQSDYCSLLDRATKLTSKILAQTDAPYHNLEHTTLVVLTGEEILRGKQIKEEEVTQEDWLHFMLALLCHDIGYIKGSCLADSPRQNLYATGIGNEKIVLPPWATDASLTPYHVDRGKLFVQERFSREAAIDISRLQHYIELTRFPIPPNDFHQDTKNYQGLARTADLIGQLGDPRYLQKLPALYREFEENGANRILGNNHPDDLRKSYPGFFWNVVYPYIKDGLIYLDVTQAGKQIIANLYGNVFLIEQELRNQTLKVSKQPVSQSVQDLTISGNPAN